MALSPYTEGPQALTAPVNIPDQSQIDLNVPVEQPDQVDLNAVPVQIPDDAAANRRAVKAHVAFGDDSPGPDQLLSEIKSGNEEQLRRRLAIARDISTRQLKMDLIQSVAGEKAKKNEALSEDEVNFLAGLSREQINHDPKTILESEYARKYFDNLVLLRGGKNVVSEGVKKDAEATIDELSIGTNIKTRQEMTKTVIEGLQRKWEDTSWASAIASHASRFIPLLENYRLHKEGSILPGTNLEERVQRIWALPPGQFQAQLEQDVKELEALNPLTAMKYAQAVLGFSSSDKFLDNTFGIIDASTLPVIGTAKLVGKAVQAAKGALASRRLAEADKAILASRNEVKQAIKDGVKADATVVSPPLEKMLELGGDLESAGKLGAFKDATKTFMAQDPLGESAELVEKVPAMFNPLSVMKGSGNLSREVRTRLYNQLLGNAADLTNSVTKTSRIIGLEGDALRVGLEEAWGRLKNQYGHLSDAVLDQSYVAAEKNAANVPEAVLELGKSKRVATEVATGLPRDVYLKEVETSLGKPDATLFESKREADYWAHSIYRLKSGEYSVLPKQQGTGFYIGVRTAVNHTLDEVRDVQISTDHVTPKGFMQTFLGRLMTPEDTVSKANRRNRNVVTHGVQELHYLAQDTADAIGSLPNKSIKRLDRFLAANRDTSYTDGDKIRRGVFYNNVGEFDTAWTSFHKKAPTEKERIAYFSAIQLNDWDWVHRNLALYREKARQGIERFSFIHQITDETNGDKAFVSTKFFDAVQRKEIPWDDIENAGIWFYDGQTNIGKYLKKNGIADADKAAIIDKLNTHGYTILQVANPVGRELRKVAQNDETIHFLVVPRAERKPLDWFQLDYRPGGHVEYKFEHWTKQPVIRRTEDGRQIYEGDQAIFNHATEAEARQFSSAMDTARILLKDNKLDELKNYLPGHLPYDFDSFIGLFKATMAADGTKLEPRLSLSDPIRHTLSGRNFLDMHSDVEKGYVNFENQIRSSYNLYGQIDKRFTSERDININTVRVGKGDEPLFRLESARNIDPLATLNRAMANIMRGRYLNDYKIQSVETWIQEFGDLLKVEGQNVEQKMATIRKNPVYYLHNGQLDTLVGSEERVAAAENARRAILNLLGSDSELGRNIGWAQRNLMSAIYNTAGQETSDWVAEHMLPIVKDPFRYARGMAFHSKLGLFNPVQLFLQAQTLTHVMAVSGPSSGLRGLSGATLMRMLELTDDPKIIEHFAKMATKLGWKKDEFLESYAALKKTGLYHVEGEVAIRDDVFDQKLFRGVFSKFLDKGTFFFREGERLVRLTAWNAAYHEWKAVNPGKILDNRALADILLRQNTLSVNMTRASSSSWQQGIMSVPTQFFAYQARLMEQFLGKRLTPAEKARAFITYSGMYGVPTAVGATTFAWPWYDDVREAALERGIDVSNPGIKMLIEGIPSTMMGVITGNEQNFAQRLGPGGVQYFKDVFQKGDVLQIFGASPKIIAGMAKSVAPVLKAVASPFVPGMGDWKFTAADFITAASEVSTINNVGKAIYALNTGKFLSKNEVDLGPATTADAVLGAIWGTQPLRQTDAFIMAESLKEQKTMQDAVKKEVVKNYRRAWREFMNGNDDAASNHMKNAKLQLEGAGFREDEKSAILQEAITGYENLVDKTNRDFIEKSRVDQYWDRVFRVFRVRPDKPNEE